MTQTLQTDQMYRFSLLVIALTLLFVGCDTTSLDRSETEQPEGVEALDKALVAEFNHLGDALSQKTLRSQSDVVDVIRSTHAERFENQPAAQSAFASAFERARSGASSSASLSSDVRQVVERVQSAARGADSYAAFDKDLASIESSVLASSMSSAEKKQALTYIVSMDRSMEFMNEYADVLSPTNDAVKADDEEEEEGWWESWGQCAAGTIGGTLTGGLGGAVGGSTVPVIGTAVGGVVGAVGGGLTGAAASC